MLTVEWRVEFHPRFAREAKALAEAVQDELAALVEVLRVFGPGLKRPRADTLAGSRHANMKELRFRAGDGVWRVAYAFDPERKAVLLVAGDKSGVGQKRFYKALIGRADERFDEHLASLDRERRKR
jgi:hypothetical protein